MLQAISIYLLKVISISGLLFLYYILALRNKQFHFYNRFYLLMVIVLSAVLPLLQLRWFTFNNHSAQTIHLLKIISGNGEQDVFVTGSSTLNWQQIALYVLTAVSFFMLLFLCFRIKNIYRLKKKFPVQSSVEFDFINTNISSAPFSFLKNIFWRDDISLQDETGKQILQHEITHIKQKHSWDKLFVQVMMCFYWINPFYYLIKKELYLIHEFIADEKAIEQSDANAFAKMLLTTQFGKFKFLPAQSIFYSSIKRRLTMLTTSKKPQFNYLRRIMVLPLVACVVCLFAFTVNNENSVSSNKKIIAAKPFILVVDAGHGGNDDGVVANGLYEKNVALKIAQEIKSLSSQYGINVVLTRGKDVFMSPKEKSDFANAQNANAFVSIHANANDDTHPNQSGFEVYISNANEKFLSNNEVLASAILQNLKTDFTIAPSIMQRQVGIWILKNSNIPSALIECGYITNANDASNLKDNAKVELMAKNILQGVAMYANNKIDNSSLYKLKNENADTTSPEKITVKKDTLGTTLKKPIPPPPPPASPKEPKIAPNPPIIDTMTQSKPVPNQVEQEAKFPGGVNGWRTYLENNLKPDVPAKNNAPTGTYTVTISFLVDENGKVSEVKAIKDPGYGTAAEAVRVIAKGPDWIPGTQDGHKVIYRQKQNITFQLTKMN